MAAPKGDSRIRFMLLDRETERTGKRSAEADTLKVLLTSIPKVDADDVPGAVVALMHAADQYRANLHTVEADGRRSKPGIAEARDGMSALLASLTAADHHISHLPLNAFSALATAYKGPLGGPKAVLHQLRTAAAIASKSLRHHPDKAGDHARVVLAYQVAAVFQDILKIRPTATSDKSSNVTGKRGGAAYARVLRATLGLAGVIEYDPKPLISAGLETLLDPFGHNT